jgi:nucleoside-diphosphate-sugar epimerase
MLDDCCTVKKRGRVMQTDQDISTSKPMAVVIGARGGFGAATAYALAKRGWTVAGMARKAQALPPYDRMIEGDAMKAADVLAAAQGARLLIHAVNPPYPDWPVKAEAMLANTIEAAKATGATILLPGNIYNFGPDAGENLRPESPQNPQTRKGAIRVRMEQMLRRAAAAGVTVIILRCGDFFGPGAQSSWFELGLFGINPKARAKAITYPGDPAIGHSWAFLPDAAEAAASLSVAAFVGRLPQGFHDFGFTGHFVTGRDMILTINRALVGASQKTLPVKSFPWFGLSVISAFIPMLRELMEMRYLWKVAHRIDGAALEAVIGPVPHTALYEAVASALPARLKTQFGLA